MRKKKTVNRVNVKLTLEKFKEVYKKHEFKSFVCGQITSQFYNNNNEI